MNVKAVRSMKEATVRTSTRNRFQQMQEEKFVIDPHNAMKLYEGPLIDTTDRSLCISSATERFDPTGYRFDKPLQKDIFHTDPYITCSNCNFLNFVDVVTIRRMLSLPAAVSAELRLAPEILPPCSQCQSADCFVIGSHDFSEVINERKRFAAEKLRREGAAATKLQFSYRRYLRRMYGSAICDMFLANKYLMYVSALKITAAARGRLGRRIAHTERALQVIKSAHPLLIRHSLKSTLRGPKVFWYKRQLEIDMLYRNYLELVQKTGFTPPRKLVEDNILEIARRVLVRQNLLIVLVQRRWRGFMARRIVRYFRTEISRLFQYRVARAMKIQRVYRGHYVRVSLPQQKADWHRQAIMDDYLASTKEDAIANAKYKISNQVMGYYGVERGEEKTARFTSRLAAAEHFDHKKMHAFWESPYADDKLGTQTDRLLNIEYSLIAREQAEIQAQHARRDFMEGRIHERGPLGYGLRAIATVFAPHTYFYDQPVPKGDLGEVEKASAGINMSSGLLANVSAGQQILTSVLCSRSKSFQIYFRAELKHLTELIVERMQHDFSRRNLGVRFKVHNEDRLHRLKQRHRLEEKAEKKLAAAAALLATGGTERHESPLKAKSRRAISSSSLDTSTTILPPHGSSNNDNTGSKGSSSSSARGPFLKRDPEKLTTDDNNHNNHNNHKATKPLTLPVIKGATGTVDDDLNNNTNNNNKKVKKKDDKHLRGNFKYPEHIYFNAMEWLYQDYDV